MENIDKACNILIEAGNEFEERFSKGEIDETKFKKVISEFENTFTKIEQILGTENSSRALDELRNLMKEGGIPQITNE